MLQYQQRRPHPALALYVHYYGEMGMPTISSQPVLDQVIPSLGKGIIFWCHTCTPAIHVRSKYVNRLLPPAFILPQGTVTNAWTHFGGLDSFAIIFKPGKMRKLFRQPWLEAQNGVIPLEDTGEPALLELRERVQLATKFEERCALAEDFLLTRLRFATSGRDIVDFSLELFHSDLSNSVASVAQLTNCSPKQLYRVFTREMGITPKSYHQVKRITYVIASLYQEKHKNLTELAYAAGYSDQAHLSRDFRKFIGVSPRQFLKNVGKSVNSKLSHWGEEDI